MSNCSAITLRLDACGLSDPYVVLDLELTDTMRAALAPVGRRLLNWAAAWEPWFPNERRAPLARTEIERRLLVAIRDEFVAPLPDHLRPPLLRVGTHTVAA